jgi:hypothetical protein
MERRSKAKSVRLRLQAWSAFSTGFAFLVEVVGIGPTAFCSRNRRPTIGLHLVGLRGGTRTPDLTAPNGARYQASLHVDSLGGEIRTHDPLFPEQVPYRWATPRWKTQSILRHLSSISLSVRTMIVAVRPGGGSAVVRAHTKRPPLRHVWVLVITQALDSSSIQWLPISIIGSDVVGTIHFLGFIRAAN